MKFLGYKLKHFRESLGLTLPEVEKLTGVRAGHLSDIENDRRNPRPQTVEKICKGLKVNENYRGRSSRGKTYVPLSGLIRCADCHKFYIGRRAGSKRKDDYQYILYQCGTYSRNGTCKNPNIPSLEIEPWLLDYIRAYAWADRSGQDILETFDHQEIEHIEIIGTGQVDLEADSPLEQKPNQEQQRLAELTQQKNRIERALARLDDTYFFADGRGLTKNEYIVKRTEMRSKLDGIDKDIKKVHKTPINPVRGMYVLPCEALPR